MGLKMKLIITFFALLSFRVTSAYEINPNIEINRSKIDSINSCEKKAIKKLTKLSSTYNVELDFDTLTVIKIHQTLWYTSINWIADIKNVFLFDHKTGQNNTVEFSGSGYLSVSTKDNYLIPCR